MRLTPAACVFFLLMCWSANALAQEFSFVKFGQQEGLHHLQVVSISQDQTGNLWLGTTTRSIYRFDGKSFYEYKIYSDDHKASLYTFKIQADRQGRVWVLTNLGLIQFDGNQSKTVPNSGKLAVGPLADLFLDTDDNVWVIDQKGDVFTLRGDSLLLRKDIQQSLPAIAGHYISKNGMLHFFNRNGQLLSDINRAEPMVATAGWRTKSPIHTVYQSEEDMYVVASASGIEKFGTSKSEFIRIPEMTNRDFISDVTVDENGWIWGIMTGKLFAIDQNNIVHWIAGSSELKNDALYLFQDQDKSIWVSVDVVGIAKYKQHAWNKIPYTAGIDITSITKAPAGGDIIFGTYNHGIIGGDRNVLSEAPITTLHYSQSGLFAGTLRRGAFRIDKSRAISVFQVGSPGLDVNGIDTFGDSLILATHRGLYIVEDSKIKFYGRKQRGTFISLANPVVVDGNVYVAGMMTGLMKLSGDSLVLIGPEKLKASTVYGIHPGLNKDYVVTGEFPELLFFDSSFTYQKSIDLSNYLSNILLVEYVDRQQLIVGSNDGLFKVMLKGDAVNRVKKYGKIDGFNGEELYANSSMSITNVGIFVGTVDGAYLYHQKDELLDLSPPSTYLTQVLLPSSNRKDSVSGFFRLPVNPELHHNQNYVTFQFSSTSLSNPYNTLFSYTMEGLDDGWSIPGSSQIISYSNLAPGRYTFKVRAISEDQVIGSTAEYAFVIHPAFWETPLFYCVVLMAAGVATVSAIQLATTKRIRKLRLQEQLRLQESIRLKKQMSMDFHDEMGNRLATMLTQASLMKVSYPNGKLNSIFDFFEKHAHAIYHGTKDFIWSIDFESNNLKEVIIYVRDFGADYFEKNGIRFHVQNEILSEAFHVALPDGYNRNIILIVKEIMTNALKHSKAHNIYFSTGNQGQKYTIEIKDDGVGFSGEGKGNGLKNIRLRAARIHGHITVDSGMGNGTSVVLSFRI